MHRFFLLLCLLLGAWGTSVAQTAEGPFAAMLTVEGPIGPATGDYLHRSFERAIDEGAGLIILRMDTPGGLSDSMRVIIRDILASPIPVATFVYPSGARAASAGTYILYASHIAAMAPATNLGAATPIQIAPGGAAPEDAEEDEGAPADALSRKVVNDAVAYIRGLARLRGRNADWAELAVREGVSLEAEEALEMEVIDLIARSPEELLEKIHGRTVMIGQTEYVLDTREMAIRPMEPDWRSRLLAVITNPNVAYILLLVGIYGLIFELSNPGMIFPGVTGAICLVLALYAFQVLPINYAGLGLILLGMALIVAEAFAPSFGILGISGVTAFVIGSVIMMDTDAPGFGISLPLIIAVAVVTAALFLLVLGYIIRARRRPVVSGSEELVGAVAEALEDFDRTGLIRVHGEIWRAHTGAAVQKGQRLKVTGRDGLRLEVSPHENKEGQP